MSEKNTTFPDLSMFHFTRNFLSLAYPMCLLSPLKRDDKDQKKTEFSLIELGEVLGMDVQEEAVKSAFIRRQSRFNNYKRLSVGFSWVVYMLIATPLLLLSFYLIVLLGISDFKSAALLKIVTYILIGMAGYVGFKSAYRIVSTVLDRHYADTLSFVACLYLFANLARKDALARLKDRKQILSRIRALRRYVLLLPHQFAADDLSPSGLALTRFRSMVEFVVEKENQITAPRSNTQDDLFVELQTLLEVLLSANYGEFMYKSQTETNPSPSHQDTNRVFNGVLKFLGSILPLPFLLLIYFFPEQSTFLGIDNKVIVLISLAWLLLAIDANLKLGIVERASSLAKAFKDLT